MRPPITIYDKNMKKLAHLDNAYNIWYDLKLNELWTCGFTLSTKDRKNIYCEDFNYVELFDGEERIELFRILPSTLSKSDLTEIEYECEHVLATLLDEVMFKYHQVGNLGFYTSQCIRYVLDRQKTKRWQLADCDFTRQFEYKWENENLLAALFSIPKPFTDKYRWEFNTTGKVWRIGLKKLSDKFKADITYKKNLTNIVKEKDPTNLVTRLYCLGFGEGDNQLTIESVNNNIPYLEKNITKYGLKENILVDRRYEHPETLKAYGEKMLDELSQPYISYSIDSVDLYRYDKRKYERFLPGDLVKINDKEEDINITVPIMAVRKDDLTGNPMDINLEIANKNRDIAGSISELQERARINDTYAQGATNLMQMIYADNAENKYPLMMKFYIPTEMARINKLILSYTIENFRAYSKSIEAGGGTYT